LKFSLQFLYKLIPVETESVDDNCWNNNQNNGERKPPFRIWFIPEHVSSGYIRTVIEECAKNGKNSSKNTPVIKFWQWRGFVQINIATIYDLNRNCDININIDFPSAFYYRVLAYFVNVVAQVANFSVDMFPNMNRECRYLFQKSRRFNCRDIRANIHHFRDMYINSWQGREAAIFV
jgi:hypothetical protein